VKSHASIADLKAYEELKPRFVCHNKFTIIPHGTKVEGPLAACACLIATRLFYAAIMFYAVNYAAIASHDDKARFDNAIPNGDG
jgi:hypothetical protein